MEVPRIWRLKAQRYRMVGNICPTCGRVFFPPRPVCPYCMGQPAQIPGLDIPALPPSKRTLDAVLVKG